MQPSIGETGYVWGRPAGPFALVVICVAMGSLGQICMKAGLTGDEIALDASPLRVAANVLPFLIRPPVMAGIGLYVVSTALWLLVLRRLPLNIAFPMVSLGYVFVVLLSAVVLHERVRWLVALPGLSCIVLGVSLIGTGRVDQERGGDGERRPPAHPSQNSGRQRSVL
jgi:undecaprenyl phosphate-alpha-L-ara4N flippase subunit ArnF